MNLVKYQTSTLEMITNIYFRLQVYKGLFRCYMKWLTIVLFQISSEISFVKSNLLIFKELTIHNSRLTRVRIINTLC